MKWSDVRVIALLTLGGLLLLGSPAAAQSTDDDGAFDFSLPGARSRGIGGAFVAIADDATSVYSNPAGLTGLFRPEVSVEVRHWRFEDLAIDRGHAYGVPTGKGLDNLAGLHDAAFTSNLDGLSFLSFAFPRNKWSFGFFHHLLARYKMDRQLQGPFFDCYGGSRGADAVPPFCEQQGLNRLFPAQQQFDLSIRGTGAAASRQLGQKVSVGVTLEYFAFDLHASRRVYNARDALTWEPANYSDQNLELLGVRTGSDSAVGVNAGVLYTPTPKWSFGATFRQGPRFSYDTRTTTGKGNPAGGGHEITSTMDAPFKVPDTYALGASWRPTDAWRIGAEYDRTRYGQLAEQIVSTAHTPADPEGRFVSEHMVLNDTTQVRLGGEYSLTAFNGSLLSLRAGTWHDPLHKSYLPLSDAATGFPAPGWSLLFPKRKGASHYTGGVGIATRRHFIVDFAVDVSDPSTTYSLSTIYRF